jgi:hypothetical protein
MILFRESVAAKKKVRVVLAPFLFRLSDTLKVSDFLNDRRGVSTIWKMPCMLELSFKDAAVL